MCFWNTSSRDFYPNILLFIESWLKGFEGEELELSSTIRQLVPAIEGSETTGAQAKRIASLIENPDYVRLRQVYSSMIIADQVFSPQQTHF